MEPLFLSWLFTQNDIHLSASSQQDLLQNEKRRPIIVRKEIDISKKATPEQLKMLADAAGLPFPKDAEYPEFSEEDLKQFKKISEVRRTERQNKRWRYVSRRKHWKRPDPWEKVTPPF